MEGIFARAFSRTRRPPSRSCRLAAVTSTTTSRPMVSVTTCRLRPLVFLPTSYPRESWPTVSAPLTDWESMILSRRRRFPSGRLPDRPAQRVVDPVGRAIGVPALEVPVDGVPGREVVRHHPPGAPGTVHVQDRVHDPPPGMLRGAAAGLDRDQRLDQGPLFVGQIGGIGT